LHYDPFAKKKEKKKKEKETMMWFQTLLPFIMRVAQANENNFSRDYIILALAHYR